MNKDKDTQSVRIPQSRNYFQPAIRTYSSQMGLNLPV